MYARQSQYDQYITDKGLVIMDKWISTTEAAEIMGVNEETVRRLCRQAKDTPERAKIVCRKFHRSWQVNRKSAEDYVKTEGGRPKQENQTDL